MKPRKTPAKRASHPAPTKADLSRAIRLADALRIHYPDAHCELDFSSPHELLVATILSAQATDVSVNKVTPALFERFPTPQHFARATPEAIEPFIRSIGLFRNKAKAIHESMKAVVENFGGQVPTTMPDLLTLRGVARKTANVVLGNAFHSPKGSGVGFVVDTHIDRLAKRFALCPPDANVQLVERCLMSLFPQQRWCELSHQLIWHGRRACKARGAGCADHPICQEFGTRCELRVNGAPIPRRPATRKSPPSR
jgi:endonuclease III